MHYSREYLIIWRIFDYSNTIIFDIWIMKSMCRVHFKCLNLSVIKSFSVTVANIITWQVHYDINASHMNMNIKAFTKEYWNTKNHYSLEPYIIMYIMYVLVSCECRNLRIHISINMHVYVCRHIRRIFAIS